MLLCSNTCASSDHAPFARVGIPVGGVFTGLDRCYHRACDDAGYVWLEDPFQDGGWSTHAHSRLRQMIRTPLLMTEHVRGLDAFGIQ